MAAGIQINWTAPEGTDPAVSYNVYRGTVSGGPYAKLNSSPVTTTSYLDSSGVAGTNYFYVITSVDAIGNESVYSSEVSDPFPAIPNPPTGVTITIV